MIPGRRPLQFTQALHAMPQPVRRRLLRGLAAALAAPVLPVHGVDRQSPQEDVTEQDVLRIGFAGPLSGPSSGVGKSMQDAVQLAVDEANEKGVLVAGRRMRLRLLAQDDRADAATAQYVARYLAGQKVVGVIGHWNSQASLAAAPIYHAAGIIQVSPASMSRSFTAQSYPGVFRTIANNDSVGLYAARYAVAQLGARRVATIDDRTPFGQGLAAQFSRTAAELGAQVLGSYSVSDKTSDFNVPLLALRPQAPDLVFFGGLDWQAALLARALRRLKLSARLMAASGSMGLPFLMTAGADGNGSLVLEPGPAPERMPGWKAFRQRYSARFDSNIDLYATFAYDAAQALIHGIAQSASADPVVVAQAMHRLQFNGVSGPISFNEEGDLRHPSFTLYEVQEQRWVPLQQFNGLPR